jgi:serine/threonine protein kinase/tetratricopeptide (TPR) repeat protein
MSGFCLGPFEVLEKIASGGMGDIWSGVHVAQDVPVAIKVLRPATATDDEFRRLFRREVRAVAQLDHPGIITLFDVGEIPEEAARASGDALAPNSPYLVMEYFERGSLESLPYPLPWRRARAILLAVLDSLAHAHARGVTHRDLKPGNILITERLAGSPIRLTDFGIAFLYSDRRTAELEGKISGTPTYMAPEQCMGEWRDFGPWTDLYALGCVAYELASGRVPFERRGLLQLALAHAEQPPPALDCPADYPNGFASWVMRLLAKAPQDRYTRSADAAAALAALTPHPSRQDPEALETRTWAIPTPGDAAAAADWTVSAPPQRPFKLTGAGLRLFSYRTVPMVDRTTERERLWAMFKRVSERGTPGLAVLEGPAGTGKSRLAEWLSERAHELGLAEHLKAEHDEALGQDTALSHMLAGAWSCLDIGAGELQARVTAILSAAGVDAPTVHRAVMEFVAPAALGSDYSPGVFYEFPSRTARYRVLYAVLRQLYAHRPLVMWLDDVHWGVDALRFVRYVLERARTEPMSLMAVATARDDLLAESPEAARLMHGLALDDAAQSVQVEPLAHADSRELVASLLHLEGDLATRLSARCGGNPLYATQLVGDWVDRGILEAGRRGFVLSGLVRPDIPDDVHAVWTQRLERVLDESTDGLARTSTAAAQRTHTKVILELAATLGGNVNTDEWISVCSLAGVPDPRPTLESLLAFRMARAGSDSWSFSHSMVRDSLERVARERNRWASHNRMCADMLEQRRPVPHWGDSERIGRHRLEAAQFEMALRPLLRGARERTRLEEYSMALGLLALCDGALDHLGRPHGDHRRLECSLLRANISLTLRELGEAEALANQVLGAAGRTDSQRFSGEALLVLARVHRYEGRFLTAQDEYRRARRALQMTGARRQLATCLSEQAHAMLDMGLLDESWAAFSEAQEIYEDLGELLPWTENQIGLARVALRQGNLDHATTLCCRVRAFGHREQLNRIEAAACEVLSEIQMTGGQLTEAVRSLATSIELFDALGLAWQALHARSLKVLLLLESGWEDQARLEFEQLSRSPETDTPRVSLLLLRCLGMAIAAGDAADDFTANFDRTTTILTGIEVPTAAVARCLRLARKRAQEMGSSDRAARIARFAAAITAHPDDGGPSARPS